MLQSLAIGAAAVCTPQGILIMLLCTAAGIIFGSIPGLSATMAIALFLPLTYSMTPLMGMTCLVSVYIGGVSGGLISAILLRMPGTPSSVATCFDGYPLTQKGQGMKALGVGIFYSFIGTIFSIIVLILLAPNLATLALKFGDYEYFSIAVFSLTMIATLSSGSMVKGLLSGLFGIAIGTVGMAPVDAAARFTFGSSQMKAGMDILPVLIGMFALSEIMVSAETSAKRNQPQLIQVSTKGVRGFGFTLKEFKEQLVNFLRSALIGLGIGILPGLGGSTSNLLAYSSAKSHSKYPEKFGTGIIDGVVATETSNNASVGGAMVPLLTLGIPGDMATAMLLGGLMIPGLQPGPLLFKEEPVLMYGIFIAMIISSFVMLIEESAGLKVFVSLLKIPKHILLPIIFVLCVVGAFGLNNRLFDAYLVIAFGLIGYIFIKLKLPVAPMIMGFVLGDMVETHLRRAMMDSKGSWEPFFTRPISALFLVITLLSIIYIAWKHIRQAKKSKA